MLGKFLPLVPFSWENAFAFSFKNKTELADIDDSVWGCAADGVILRYATGEALGLRSQGRWLKDACLQGKAE